MSFNHPIGGAYDLGEVDYRDLAEWSQALENNALGIKQSGINYPLQGTPFDSNTLSPNGELSPLVPQSIQNTLDSTTFTDEDIVLWPRLQAMAVEATSPLHEYNLVHQHGSYGVDPFFGEGGIAGTSEAQFERKTVRVKYMMEVITITDVGIMTGLMMPNPSALALRTQQGTLSLTQKLETYCLHADSALNPNQFDGIIPSVRRGAPRNYTDFLGNQATPQKLQEIVGKLVQPPLYGRPNVAFCDYGVFTSLANQAATYGRHDQMVQQDGQRGLYWGFDKLYLGTPYGRVELVPMPFLNERDTPMPRNMGDGAPNTIVGAITEVAAPGATGWTSADVGYAFWYIAEFHGDRGTSVTAPYGGATLTATDKAHQHDFADSSYALAGAGGGRYYKVYRARVAAGAPAPTDLGEYHKIASQPRNTVNAGATRFNDVGLVKPETGYIIFATLRPDTIQWTKFLPFTRRNFPTLDTTMKFGLMLFGALTMKVPSKWWVCANVARSL